MAGPARQMVRDVLGWVALVVGSAVFAATAAVVQAGDITVAGRTLPYGLVLVLGTLAVVVRAAVWWRRTPLAGVIAGVTWLVVTFVLARSGPGGDVLLPEGWRSQAYLLGGVVIVLVMVLLPLPAQPPEPGAGGPPPATADAAPDR